MTPTFDFAAFLNSPNAVNDGPNGAAAKGPPALINPSTTNSVNTFDLIENPFGFTDESAKFVPDWACTSISNVTSQPQPSNNLVEPAVALPALVDTEMEASADDDAKPTTMRYRSKIASHHFAQLRHSLPQLDGATVCASAGLGGAGQRSSRGSQSSISVPMSQATRPKAPKRASTLTIQERRRLARRSYAAGHSQSTVPGSATTPTLTQRRGCSPSTPADHARQFSKDPSESVIFNTQFSNLSSEFTKRAYSHSGFDLIRALTMVAQRPNPKVDIGPVDLSCSFTVSDAQHPDQPIVHCSDTFCKLTGYSRDEIIGRNCRFLQAPDGKVGKGSERLHTDNGAVNHFRKHCKRMQECQTSLINYRRDGSPFINLVTIVPITWGNSAEPVFLIGFQVDLVEQPGAVLERTTDGLYVVNYSKADNNEPSLNALTDPHVGEMSDPQTVDPVEEQADKEIMMAHELADVIGSGSEETSKWARVLLENSHDLIHVLSLKGTFLYVSPSVERLLGYKPEEMLGRSISEFCHPSDVVPVFRELKDSTSNASIAAAARHWAQMDGTVNPITKGGAGQTGPQVNLIMRMRHKHRGHEWIESVGKLHLEQGKGRKVVVSTGRSRPVYNLPWDQARRSLNHKGPGFWSKVSSDGLILSTSGNVADVLDTDIDASDQPKTTSLVGMHMSDVVNSDALASISTALRNLNVTGIPHHMNNGVGSVPVIVMSTLIPSSAGGEGLPTVFVHTQKVSVGELGQMQVNKIHFQAATVSKNGEVAQSAKLEKGEPLGNSVFGELSTHRSSSWVFELHQLKLANKRLREEIRSHQRRVAGGAFTHTMPAHSPVKAKIAQLPSLSQANLTVSLKSGSITESSLESRPLSTASTLPSGSGFGSGSGSDSTAATSANNSDSNMVSLAGNKRARS